MKIDFNPADFIDDVGRENFEQIAHWLHSDRDWVNIVVGPEGSGKSVLAHIICGIVDANYSTNRVVFPTSELRWRIHHSKPYQAINQDEGAETWLSLNTTNIETKKMIRSFMEIRCKNLFINICIPDAGMITTYLKTHRASSICRVSRRGAYSFFSRQRLRGIKRDSATKRIIWPKPNFVGYYRQFPKKEFWNAYLEKKHEHLGNRAENPKLLENALKMERVYKNTMDFRAAGQGLHIHPATIMLWRKNGKFRRLRIKPIATPKGWRLTFGDFQRLKKDLYPNLKDNFTGGSNE